MRNLYEQFRRLLPDAPLQVGTVTQAGTQVVIVELPGGGKLKARGSASLGQRVFVRDGVIEGQAPSLSTEVLDI